MNAKDQFARDLQTMEALRDKKAGAPVTEKERRAALRILKAYPWDFIKT